MINTIKVNTTRLGKDADIVNTCIQDMKKEAEKMKTSVKSLDSVWDGKSSVAFQKAINKDIKLLEKIIANLEGTYRFEVDAKKKYEDCETKVNELVNGIKV